MAVDSEQGAPANAGDKSNLNWATSAVILGAVYIVVSSIVERDWLELSGGIGMAMSALLLRLTWPTPSPSARKAIHLVGFAMLALILVSLWRDLR